VSARNTFARHAFAAQRSQNERAAVGLEIWNQRCPIVGDVIFDGTLNLPGGVLSVSEFDGLNSARTKVGAWGDHRITVRVDNEGEASRVMVIRDCADEEGALTSVRGYELPMMTMPDGEVLTPMSELALILATHDLPLARLAAAVKIPLTRDDLSRYSIRMIVEWLRWLHPAARVADCQALGDRLAADLAHSSEPEVDDRSLTLARDMLAALGAQG
jgi:hypothetical protein